MPISSNTLTADHVFEIPTHRKPYKISLHQFQTDHIQKTIAKNSLPYEMPMLEDMRERLKETDTFLDIGANIGNHSLYLCAAAMCKVVSFEPNPILLESFRESIKINEFEDRLTVNEFGLSDQAGFAHFALDIPNNLGAQHLERQEHKEHGSIELQRLDDVPDLCNVRMIKIDVERMEENVLRGGIDLIRQHKPLLYIEAQKQHHFIAIERIIKPLGYVYWDTFNVTPTHLFIHEAELSTDQKISHLLSLQARDTYYMKSQINSTSHRMNQTLDKLHRANESVRKSETKYAEASSEIKSLKSEVNNLLEELSRKVT